MKKLVVSTFVLFVSSVFSSLVFLSSAWAADTGAYLQINLKISEKNRPAAAAVYKKYKQPFLAKVKQSTSKTLLINAAEVQVLHGFENTTAAQNYLGTELFKNDVVRELKPLLDANPEILIYQAM